MLGDGFLARTVHHAVRTMDVFKAIAGGEEIEPPDEVRQEG